jgi:hypothetical protein
MTPHKGEPGWIPSPELLAAYADGELDGDDRCGAVRRRLEAWLAEYPDAAAALDAQRRVAEWFRATATPDPPEAAWTAMAAKLHALPPGAGGRIRPGRRLAWLAALGATAAAGLWLALTLLAPSEDRQVAQHQPPKPLTRGVTPPSPDAVEVLPVATAAEVEILSVQGEDTASVVVGELPVQGLLQLLQPGELTLTSVQPTPDRMVPEVRTSGRAPMIWAPVDDERGDPEEPEQGRES